MPLRKLLPDRILETNVTNQYCTNAARRYCLSISHKIGSSSAEFSHSQILSLRPETLAHPRSLKAQECEKSVSPRATLKYSRQHGQEIHQPLEGCKHNHHCDMVIACTKPPHQPWPSAMGRDSYLPSGIQNNDTNSLTAVKLAMVLRHPLPDNMQNQKLQLSKGTLMLFRHK